MPKRNEKFCLRILINEYFGFDYAIVCDAIKSELPTQMIFLENTYKNIE